MQSPAIYSPAKKIFIYLIFIVLGCLYRFWLISNNNVLFWFDQARDAIVINKMIYEKDIKIQGPSASGTNDSVYHGVLYYYVICPIYLLAKGNPAVVSAVLGVISMLALVPIGELALKIFKSKSVFLVTLFLFSISVDAAQMGTWLSNPMLALITIPAFYYYLYEVFWENKTRKLWLMALFLGLSHQAVIFTVYLFGVILIAWWIQQSKRKISFSRKNLFLAFVVYGSVISTMVLNQLLLMMRGVFNPLEVFSKLNNFGVNPANIIRGVFDSYANLISFSFFPTKPLLSVFLFIYTIFYFIKIEKRKFISYILLFLLGPLVLIAWQYRNSYHTYIGLLPIVFVFTAQALEFIKKNLFCGKYIFYGILLLLLFSNVKYLQYSNTTGQHPVAIQTGTTLKDKLELIDYTYLAANYEIFSISSFTSPYDFNTTWAYLYSWYGKEKYGYTPFFVGPSQKGISGGDLLSESDLPKQVHFALYEPLGGIPEYLQSLFVNKQNSNSSTIEKKEFGSMVVEKRLFKSDENF